MVTGFVDRYNLVRQRNNNISQTTFMVLSACHNSQNHYDSSLGSYGECRLSIRWLLTLRPSQLTWAVSPLVGCYDPHHHCHLLLLLSSKANIYLPSHRVGLRHCSKSVQPMLKAVCCNGCRHKHNSLPLDHCDLHVNNLPKVVAFLTLRRPVIKLTTIESRVQRPNH